MTSHQARYLVGIDLGTTHTVVAFADLNKGGNAKIEPFEVEQLTGPGEIGARPLLPSLRYHPAAGELAAADSRLPWGQGDVIFGEWARELGSKTHGRLVTSAKSWLCNAAVDRSAAILPWGAAEGVNRISPLEASASYLDYVRCAWNHRFPEHMLENQEVVVTLPASFDESARALTLQAARMAGLKDIHLLEEPQAACYDWLWRHRKSLARSLAGVELLLVIDIGGGTTDLSLIRVEAGDGSRPALSRIGVGNHLMLGGDNIDLALAHRAEGHLAMDGKRLSAAQLAQLVEQCRRAKEKLLAGDAVAAATVTLLGEGSRLIGGARSTELDADEVRKMVLEGFFPLAEMSEQPERRRSGVVEFGLPYVPDPAVSRHLAAFLTQHCPTGTDGRRIVPDAVLLNGGAFRSSLIEKRILAQLTSWRGEKPRQLKNERPDLAVAHGAVAFALARHGLAVQRIGGGSPRSYFLAVDTEGSTDRQHGVCLLPKGTEAGREILLEHRSFALRLGQPVRFHLASSTGEHQYRAGEMVSLQDGDFVQLPPLAVAFQREEHDRRGEIQVSLSATLTEIGTLAVQCVASDDPGRRWDLEFQIRSGRTDASAPPGGRGGEHPRSAEAVSLVQRIFGRKSKDIDARAARGVRNDLEKLLGRRDDWNSALLRTLFGALLDGLPHRRRSADHERTWLSLAGYCLRPGFGVVLDDWRVEQVWSIYGQGVQHVNEVQIWAEWWTLWRRICGGLVTQAQERIFADLSDFIDPERAKKGNLPALARKRAFEDMLRLAATLERIPASSKIQLGEWLLQRLKRGGESSLEIWWALGRVGARVPFYGSPHEVVPPEVAESWLSQLNGFDWKRNALAGFAATLIARMSDDRERDVSAEHRGRVMASLRAAKAPESWIGMVRAFQHLDQADEKRAFGEALPPGLKLLS